MSKLDRERVIRHALDLLNETGVDGLTTRKLAERLDVQQPALYWHFRSKRALLDALAEAMLAERHTRPHPRQGEDWRDFLKENARSFRHALLAYRDGARIHAGTRPSSAQQGPVEAQLQLLCTAGFPAVLAAHALLAVSHYTVGAVLEQQSADSDARDRGPGRSPSGPPASSFLQSVFDALEAACPDAAFESGLDALINGLECTLRRTGENHREAGLQGK